MTPEEMHAEMFLEHLGYTDIAYEPRGKSTVPDFVVNGTIAVEVRRLNESHGEGKDRKGLEEAAIPFGHQLLNMATRLGAPKAGVSWYVSQSISRPIADPKTLSAEVESKLRQFRDGQDQREQTLKPVPGLELHLTRAQATHSTFFVVSGQDDDDSGGWLFEALERNVRHCLLEKTNKVAAVRGCYRAWWLVLVDWIAYGHARPELGGLREALGSSVHGWDRVILVGPLDPRSWFEVEPVLGAQSTSSRRMSAGGPRATPR